MKRQTLNSINKSYHKHMKSLTSKGREKEILAALRDGKNTYMRMDRLESSSFDSSWIEVIENVIYDLGQIIGNPRLTTKVEGNIVPVELARKTGAESVRHLASHTQYIKEIDDYGNVIPSKIMTMINEDDMKTYENRFIATFVRRLVLFVGKRYEFVSNFAELHDEQVLMFKNKSIVDGAEVEIETKIRINHKSDDEMSIKNNDYVERIAQMRQYILYFYNSDFMKHLKTEKDVHNPILQTNIIRKNPLYHHCYEVYKFIEKYEHLGVKYKVDEHFSVFNDTELAEINNTLFANYITLHGKDRSANAKSTHKVYKPKILTSNDDEMFIYGPRLSGPIEFLRIDEGYQRYLDSKIRKDLPLHPTKREKEYYAEEYKDKAENREDKKQKEDLIKRVNKQVAAFNKQAAKIDQEREEARLRLLAEEKRIIKQEEDDMLAAARAEIIAASLAEQDHVYKEQIEDEVSAVKVVEPSHPYQEPLTYEEATLEIWPQLANAPTLREVKDEEPVVEQQPVQEVPVSEPQVEEVPAQEEQVSEPQEQPVPEDLSNEPEVMESEEQPQEVEYEEVLVEAPEDANIEEEQPKVDNQYVEPQPVVKEYAHPYQEPVSYDEAALQIWPQLANAPRLRVASASEEQPVEQPKAEPAPVIENKQEQPVVKEQRPQRVKIPGHFIVKLADGYYVDEGQVSPYKEGAKIFDDFNLAADIKKAKGGKVVKLLDSELPPESVAEPVVEKEPEVKEEKPASKAQAKKETSKEEKPKEAKAKPAVKKAAPVLNKPVMKKAVPTKQKAAPKAQPKPAVVVEEKPQPQRVKIPGKFIVKLLSGYYVNENEVSIYKEDAKIFDDFNLALDIKKAKGGKIVKL